MSRCIDICRSEEVTPLHMKSLSEPVDNINQVKSKEKKNLEFRLRTGNRERSLGASFVAMNTHRRERVDAAVNAIESDEDLEEISVVRVYALKDIAVFAEMLVQQKPVRFQIDCGASANILPSKYVEDVVSSLVPSPSSCVMAPRSSLLGPVLCQLLISGTIRRTK